jgi:hypothetical protein
MKCVYCGKQEEYTEVKVNVERLLGMVQEAFDSTQDYKMACKTVLEVDGIRRKGLHQARPRTYLPLERGWRSYTDYGT